MMKYHASTQHQFQFVIYDYFSFYSYHLVARAYSCKGNFRQALNHEKQTYKMYQTMLGDDHDKTKESAEFLRHLTQQAVSLQRTVSR